MPTVKLTIQEANMLDHLTHDTKMDCWFWINENLDVCDLENNNQIMDTAEAVLTVDDGITDIHDYSLTPEEIQCYEQLLERIHDARD